MTSGEPPWVSPTRPSSVCTSVNVQRWGVASFGSRPPRAISYRASPLRGRPSSCSTLTAVIFIPCPPL
ncbi:MAG TPA: hypothetical protein VH257_09220, partial [Chloroflexota bacterium]|nr:hypothetical protein [Chloroflexota bacterium]